MTAPKFREGQQDTLLAHNRQLRSLRRWLLVVAVLALLGAAAGAIATWQASRGSDNNCVRIHELAVVGAEIIAEGRADVEQYRREGLLTEAQYRRAIRTIDRRVQRWISADCPTPPGPEARP